MAGAFGKYQAEVEKFKNDYGVNFSFERYEKEVKEIRQRKGKKN